jgi:hypothetical protein
VHIPFRERLWSRPGPAAHFLGHGKTWLYGKIRSGEIVSKLDGRARMIHVPSLIARYGLVEDQIESAETVRPVQEAEYGAASHRASPTTVKDKRTATAERSARRIRRPADSYLAVGIKSVRLPPTDR